MIYGIKIWAEKIVIVVIICTIIELILPETNNKKYIKTVMALIIVYTIISPIISKIQNKDISLNKYLSIDNYKTDTIETIAPLDTNELIEKAYIEKLKADICENLKALGFTANNIDLVIETEDEKIYGTILSLKIYVEKKNNSNKISIEKIEIGKSNNDNLTNEEKQEIISYLSKIYDLDYKKIEVR